MGEPEWPVTMMWWNKVTDEGQGIEVIPAELGRKMADALGKALEGDLGSADEALAHYEREVT